MRWLLEIPITTGRDDAAREAAEELRKAKYSLGVPPELKRLADMLARAVQDWFRNLYFPESVGSGVGAWIVLAIVVIALLGIVALLIHRYGLPRFSKRVDDAAVETDESMQPEDYRSLAERAAAAGDWRTAVQESFRAMVRELEIRTLIERRPARTAFETAALVARGLPALADPLYQGAVTFNEVVYGHRAATAADYELMRQVETTVLAAADEGYVEADS